MYKRQVYILVAHLIWDRRSTSVGNRLDEILQHKVDTTVTGPAPRTENRIDIKSETNTTTASSADVGKR